MDTTSLVPWDECLAVLELMIDVSRINDVGLPPLRTVDLEALHNRLRRLDDGQAAGRIHKVLSVAITRASAGTWKPEQGHLLGSQEMLSDTDLKGYVTDVRAALDELDARQTS